MEKPKIYLETTLFNYFFEKDRDAHAYVMKLFTEIAEKKYEAFTSEDVVNEFQNAPIEKRKKMFALIGEYNIKPLPVNDAVNTLADIYVAEGIIPAKYRTDGVHIAVAAVNGLDFVVSMNFQHIVKPKVKRLANAVNIVKGFRSVEIVFPMEFVEGEISNPIEDEIDQIRLKIYEETKDMTTEQRVEYTRKQSEAFVKEMGYKFVVINPQGHMRLVKIEADTPKA